MVPKPYAPPVARSSQDLHQLTAFAGLSEREVNEVSLMGVTRRLLAGEALFEQGHHADRFYLLLSGRLRVTQLTPQGRQIIVRLVKPGDLCGIAKAMHRSDYPGTATAMVKSDCLSWPASAWTGLLEKYPRLAVNIMQLVGARLQQAQERISEMATQTVERRVSRTILRLASEVGRDEPDGIYIDVPISKQDIAELSGTTLYTASRLLSGWREAGLVDTGRRMLLIRDREQLRRIADGTEATPKGEVPSLAGDGLDSLPQPSLLLRKYNGSSRS